MSKKIVSICLTILMLITMLPMATLAAEINSPSLSVDSADATPGDSITVSIKLKNNPGIVAGQVNVAFDSGLTLTGATKGDAFPSYITFTMPKQLSTVGEINDSCNIVWGGTDINNSDIKDGTVLTLTFRVSEEAEVGDTYNITVTPNRVNDKDLATVELNTVQSRITIIDYTPGDVNDDGIISMLDTVLISRYIVDGCTYDPDGYAIRLNEKAADVNDDGIISMLDTVMISRYIVDGCKTDPNGYNIELKGSTKKCQHEMQAFEAKAATCTEDGNIAYWYCGLCGKYFTDVNGSRVITYEDTVIASKGHTSVIDPAVPATFESTGLTEGSHCSVCGTVLQKQEVTPKLIKTEYSITYNVYGSDTYLQKQPIDNPYPTSYTADEEINFNAYTFTVPGYNFRGWYTADGTLVTGITKGSTGNMVLFARWEKEPYKITFDSPDVPVAQETYYVDSGMTLTNPSWFGYTFVGWSIDGKIITRIEPGTTGNLTLHANWTSNRNMARAVAQLDTPNVIEDYDNGQYLFVYEIGTIENVPLAVNEYIGNSQGVDISKSITVQNRATNASIQSAAKAVSNATTKTNSWTLSEDWNSVTSATNTHEEEKGKTEGRVDSEGNVTGSKYYISNSSGGATSSSSSGGGSTNNSSKVTDGDSTGISGSYTSSHEDQSSVGLHADVSVGLEMHAGTKLAGASVNTNISAGVNTEDVNRDSKSSTNSNSRNTNHSEDVIEGGEEHWDTSSSSSATWNSTNGYETSSQTSRNTELSSTISEVVADRYSYTSTSEIGGSNSSTASTGESQELKNEYSSTVEYSTENTVSETKTVSYHSDADGYYRIITAGTMHVFAVVGFDIATSSYFTYTYNILDKERHEYLDYSMVSANFNDCENGILPFEVPYEVHEYISEKIARSAGLVIDYETGTVEEYNGSAEYVIVPEYVSINNGDGTYSAVRIRHIAADAFKGNTTIKRLVLPKYVYEIPDNAFEGCTSLLSVRSLGIDTIGKGAFKNCSSLEKYTVDRYIESLGDGAFVGCPEIVVEAKASAVADAGLIANASKLTLNLSYLEDSFDNRTIDIPSDKKYFAILSNGATYNNLTIKSAATETYLSNFKLIANSDTPIVLESRTVTLNRVTVENSPGFSMVLKAPLTDLKLFGTVNMSSAGDNAVISKNVMLSKADAEVAGRLKLDGNYLVCGEVGNSNMISLTNGEIITITEDQYNRYLTSSIITFDANGGSVSEKTKSVYYGQQYGDMPIPTKEHYGFDGWYTEPEGGTIITEESVVSALVNQTLFAHWIPNAFTVTFNANGGKVSTASAAMNYGETLSSLPKATRDYYTFKGWYTEANNGTVVTSVDSSFGSSDIILYAHWSLNPTSGWVVEDQVPTDAQVVSTKYSYNSWKSSTSSSLSGYTRDNSKTTYTISWGDTAWYDSTRSTSETYRYVGSREVVASSNYKTVYHYYRYATSLTGGSSSYGYQASGTNYYQIDLDYELDYAGNYGGYEAYKWWYNGTNYRGVFKCDPFTTQEWVSDNYKTQYGYQSGTKNYTYWFYKTAETTSQPTASSTVTDIVKWVQYRPKTVAGDYTETARTTYNGHTYILYTAPSAIMWANAKIWCENNGGYLTVVTSSGENAALKSLANGTYYWMGLSKTPATSWTWVNGETFSYSDWAEGQPSGNEWYCGTYTGMQWNDYVNNTGTVKAFIMELNA